MLDLTGDLTFSKLIDFSAISYDFRVVMRKRFEIIRKKLYLYLIYTNANSEKGTMCAMKEVKLITDDQTSKECLKQLNQVCLIFLTHSILNNFTKFHHLNN